jgi:hypothetical protein
MVHIGHHRLATVRTNSQLRRYFDALGRLMTSELAYRRDSVHRSVSGAGCAVIHLSGLPGDIGRAGRPTLDLAPGGVCLATEVTPGAGALLPHRFTLTCDAGPKGPPSIGGLFSVALSCGSPRLAVSQHPALRSPDLPRQGANSTARFAPGRDHPASSIVKTNSTAPHEPPEVADATQDVLPRV